MVSIILTNRGAAGRISNLASMKMKIRTVKVVKQAKVAVLVKELEDKEYEQEKEYHDLYHANEEILTKQRERKKQRLLNIEEERKKLEDKLSKLEGEAVEVRAYLNDAEQSRRRLNGSDLRTAKSDLSCSG